MRGNLTEKEWRELLTLEYVLTWQYSDDEKKDEKRYKELIKKKDANNFNCLDTLLCAAFPGTGKSYFYNHSDKKVLDSDSSKFNKKEFPQNYIKHIKENINKADIICISSHEEVRKALVDEGLKFTLVYPEICLKDEYIKRFKERGSTEGFIKLISDNWNEWIVQLQKQNGCDHIVLKSGQYISNKL